MSAPNFVAYEDFPLYVKADDAFIIGHCPECSMWTTPERGGICPECGSRLEDIGIDYIAQAIEMKDINNDLISINKRLRFYELGISSGRYSGLQLTVEELHGSALDISEDWTNADCKAEFNMSKAKTLKAIKAEQREVKNRLRLLAHDYAFRKIFMTGLFSNGEATYSYA